MGGISDLSMRVTRVTRAQSSGESRTSFRERVTPEPLADALLLSRPAEPSTGYVLMTAICQGRSLVSVVPNSIQPLLLCASAKRGMIGSVRV